MTEAIREVEQRIAANRDESQKIQLLLKLVDLYFQQNPPKALSTAEEAYLLAEQVGSESQKIETLLKLIGLYFRQDLPKALATAEEAHLLAERAGSELQVARAVLGRGNCLYVLGRHKEALAQLTAAQEMLHHLGSVFFESTAWINIGGIYAEWGDYHRSLECKLQSLKLARESGHKRNEATCLGNLASTYYKLRDIDRALEYCYEQRALCEKHGDIDGYIHALTMLGIIHFHALYDIERAEALFLQCIQESQEGMYEGSRIMALENLGDIYMRSERFEKAEEVLQEAVHITQRIGDKRLQVSPLIIMGRLYAHKGDYTLALQYLAEAQELAEETSRKEQLHAVHSEYAACYKCMGNYAKALEHHELFHSIKEEIFDEELQKQVSNLTVLHDVEKAQSAKELAEKEREITHLKNVELSSVLAQVQALNERLERLNKEKNDVIGVVAHDLKSPLSGMRMVASLVKSHHTRMPGDEVEQQLEGIEQTADRMLTIVNNLLDVHAIEAGEQYSTQEAVDVMATLVLLVDEYRERALGKAIGISIAEPNGSATALCSREGLLQIVENLLSNAVKFSPQGKSIQVRVYVEGGSVRIEIADEGPGISKKEQALLFKKFSRLTARPTAEESSTGLGLWIVRQVVESMHGRVWCESKLRKGARFIVELPCAALS